MPVLVLVLVLVNLVLVLVLVPVPVLVPVLARRLWRHTSCSTASSRLTH
jgi:hypothetical protein